MIFQQIFFQPAAHHDAEGGHTASKTFVVDNMSDTTWKRMVDQRAVTQSLNHKLVLPSHLGGGTIRFHPWEAHADDFRLVCDDIRDSVASIVVASVLRSDVAEEVMTLMMWELWRSRRRLRPGVCFVFGRCAELARCRRAAGCRNAQHTASTAIYIFNLLNNLSQQRTATSRRSKSNP